MGQGWPDGTSRTKIFKQFVAIINIIDSDLAASKVGNN